MTNVPTATTRPYGRTPARAVTALTAVLLLLAGWLLGTPAAHAAPTRAAGTFTVSGYDYLTGLQSDVVAADPDTNLVVTFSATRALDDGTLTVTLPTRDWPDPLRVGYRLHPNDPMLRGSVVVRPSADFDELTDTDCRAAEGQTLDVAVMNGWTARTATVSHLSCLRGQSVTLRVFDVTAPRQAGRTAILASARDAAGGSSATVPLDVRPVPTTRLVVEPSEAVGTFTNAPVEFTVTAVDVRGRVPRVNTRYVGTVNVIPVGTDCYVTVQEGLPLTFTPTDRGVKTIHVTFGNPQTFRIEAYDVAERALPGYSGDVLVAADPDFTPTTCSRAYH